MVYMEEFKRKKPAFSEACERLYKRISELATSAPQTFKLELKAKKSKRQSDQSARQDSNSTNLKKANIMLTDSLLQESTFTAS